MLPTASPLRQDGSEGPRSVEVIVDHFEEKQHRQHDLHALPGHLVVQEQGALGITYRLLMRNAADLEAALEQFADPTFALSLLDLSNQQQFDEFVENVGRLLHNYLASVKALVDHTRRLVKDLWPQRPSFVTELYEPRVKALFGDPEAIFLQKLRDYALHYRPVPLATKTIFGRATFDNTFSLASLELKKWNGWGAGRNYLAAQPDEIPLLPLVTHYQISIERFYLWFGTAAIQEHIHEVAEYDRAMQAYEAWLAEWPHIDL
jgi:hypothetical protein